MARKIDFDKMASHRAIKIERPREGFGSRKRRRDRQMRKRETQNQVDEWRKEEDEEKLPINISGTLVGQ